MIRIFNKKISAAILIDETSSCVSFAPNHYHEDSPHIEIRIWRFNFSLHCYSCSDCKAFQESFGTTTKDWYVEYMGKIRLLDLYELGTEYGKNTFQYQSGETFSGTIFKINLSKNTIENLSKKLEEAILSEEYEKCCIIRDTIISMEDNLNPSKE